MITEFPIYTVPSNSTPHLSDIYNSAFDEIVPPEGISERTVIEMDNNLRAMVIRNLEEIGYPHDSEQIVSDWGVNFNNSRVKKKCNLYHVIFTVEKNDSIYNDINGICVLGWATHVKCKSGGFGKFLGRIHTH